MVNKTNDPRSENEPIDLDDDDDIIELTEEVIVKPKKDDKTQDLKSAETVAQAATAAEPLRADELGREPEDEEEDSIDLSGTPESEAEGAVLDLDEAFDDDEPEFAEDRIKLTDGADEIVAEDDDIINFREETDVHAEVSDDTAADTDTDEGIFQDEEEIPLEYESSEDEYDFFDLDDNKPLEELETITMADEEPDGGGDDDTSVDPLAALDFGDDEDDDIIAMAEEEPDGGRDDDSSVDPLAELDFGDDEDDDIIAMDAEEPDAPDLMAFDDDDTLEFESGGDLPDLTDEIEFDFDDDVDENGLAEADDDAADDSDDIIARAVEKSLAPDEVTAQIDLAMEPAFEFTEDNETMAEEDTADAVLTAKTAEELRKLAEADDDLDDIDDDIDLEFADEDEVDEIADIGDLEPGVETMALEDLEDIEAEDDDDIIEITEFDEHFPEEDERKLAHAGVLDVSDEDDDDFLELIEVEDEEPIEDEEVIEFRESDAQADEDEIDSFFSETLADEPVFENGEMPIVEETPALSTDMAMATAPPTDEDEEFDFSLDSSEISQQIDRLDTFLADDLDAEPDVAALPSEPDVASLSSAPSAEEETPDEDQPADEEPAQATAVTPDQIDAIVERVIEEKFGGNIETIIYDVIEKAVSKEIDRLKGALLGGGGSNQDDDE